jgi:hypothetical protein
MKFEARSKSFPDPPNESEYSKTILARRTTGLSGLTARQLFHYLGIGAGQSVFHMRYFLFFSFLPSSSPLLSFSFFLLFHFLRQSLAMEPRLTSNLQSCLSLPSARTMSLCYHTQPHTEFLIVRYRYSSYLRDGGEAESGNKE